MSQMLRALDSGCTCTRSMACWAIRSCELSPTSACPNSLRLKLAVDRLRERTSFTQGA